MVNQFYIAYASYGGYEELIQQIDREKYDTFANGQPIDERIHCSVIHLDSTDERDPIVDIVAITEYRKLGKARADFIGQRVVNWLFDNGYIDKPKG
jgi:hypothetical protein